MSMVCIPGPPKSAEVSAFLEKGTFLLLAVFLVFLAEFFQHQVLCKKKAAGHRRILAGHRRNSAEFRGSRFQHVGVFVGFRFLFFDFLFSLAGGVLLDFRRKFLLLGPLGRKFFRRRVQVYLPPTAITSLNKCSPCNTATATRHTGTLRSSDSPCFRFP